MENGKRPPIVTGLVVCFGLFTLLTVVGFMIPWRPTVATEEGAGIDAVITFLLFATGILIIVGHVVLIRFLLRAKDNQEEAYVRPAPKVEWMWSIIPVGIMMLLAEVGVLYVGGPTWDKLFIERAENPVVFEIVGKQFEWLIRYPGADGEFGNYDFKWVNGVDNPMGLDEDDEAAADDIVSRNVAVIPVGRPVKIGLRTHDVIHSFFVPEFRVKQDVIPGFGTEIRFTPTRKGEFELTCAELCGLGHYRMRGLIRVVDPSEYKAWLANRETFFPED